MNTAKTSSRGKKFMILGIILFVSPPLILLIIYGNREITGLAGTLSLAAFPVTLIGIIFFGKGLLLAKPKSPDVIIDKMHLDNPVVNAFTKSMEAHNSWVWSLIFALGGLIIMPEVWQDTSTPNVAKDILVFFIIGSILITIITKYIRKTPWPVLLIGNIGLIGRDERETTILHKAAYYSLAVIVGLMTGFFLLLIFLPTPSLMAIANIIYTFSCLVTGLYGFFAWKFGLK